MSCIRSKDTSIEVKLRKALWHCGIRYRKNYSELPGKPDIAITKYKIAIFCDSEFFHGKDWDTLEKRIRKGNNSDYWEKKITRNMNRDNMNNKLLEEEGWKVLRFWGSDISKHIDDCVKTVKETILDIKVQE